MSSTNLEKKRALFEDIENNMKNIVFLLQNESKMPSRKIVQKHQINQNLDEISKKSTQQVANLSKSDPQIHAPRSMSNANLLDYFFSSVSSIKEKNIDINLSKLNDWDPEKATNEPAKPISIPRFLFEPEKFLCKPFPSDYTPSECEEVAIQFTSAEKHGNFLDLQQNHQDFLTILLIIRNEHLRNSPNVKFEGEIDLDYFSYLEQFCEEKGLLVRKAKGSFFGFSNETKNYYLQYLKSLSLYMKTFYLKTNPIQGLQIMQEWERKFCDSFLEEKKQKEQDQLIEKTAKKETSGNVQVKKEKNPPENSNASTSEAVTVKKEPIDNNIASTNENKNQEKKKKKRKRNKSNKTTENSNSSEKELNLFEKIMFYEAEIYEMTHNSQNNFATTISSLVSSTRIETGKRQTKTWNEVQLEIEKEEEEEIKEQEALKFLIDQKRKGVAAIFEEFNKARTQNGAEDSDSGMVIDDPLKLQKRWDGRPIPYWLYKYNELGRKFVCEICGNMTYWGPRAFERHFQEPRHATGMKFLGIPNTRDFHSITKIKDAHDLWERIKKKQSTEDWDAEEMEEYEDSEGNILNKKMYADLKKQGLID